MNNDKVRKFICEYYRELNAQSIEKLVSLFQFPTCFQSGKGIVAIENEEKLARHIQQNFDFNQIINVREICLEGIYFLESRDSSCIANIDWSVKDHLGKVLGEFQSTIFINTQFESFKIGYIIDHFAEKKSVLENA